MERWGVGGVVSHVSFPRVKPWVAGGRSDPGGTKTALRLHSQCVSTAVCYRLTDPEMPVASGQLTRMLF